MQAASTVAIGLIVEIMTRRRSAIHLPCDDGRVSAAPPIDDVPTVTRPELIGALRARRITLVDVLSPESFAAMHIPGAINIPVADIPRRAPELLPDHNAPIVTYCGGPT
jgi:3-mercaptopyruvate sulfurtransferase SseA